MGLRALNSGPPGASELVPGWCRQGCQATRISPGSFPGQPDLLSLMFWHMEGGKPLPRTALLSVLGRRLRIGATSYAGADG